MRNKRILHITMLLALAAMLVMILGCGSDQPAAPEAGGETKTPEPEAQTIPVGVILPMSGTLAAYGESTLQGIQLMADQINTNGGINGREIELVVENNEGDTTKSAAALRKLIGLKKVLAIVGPITSTNTMAVARDAERKGTTLISPTATNDAVTGYGAHVFRTCFNDSFQGIAIAKFAIGDLGIQNAVAFQDTTSDYSVGLCKNFYETFVELGGEVGEMLSYKQGDTEFTAQLRKVREMNVGALFVPGYPPELPLIINEARSLQLETVLLGADGWDNDDVVENSGANLEGCHFAAAFSTEVASPELQAFLTAAQAAGIENPGSFEALGYDSVGLVAEAIRNAEPENFNTLEVKRSAVRDALANLKDYAGATGSITMTPSGDPLKSLVVLRYENTPDGVIKKFVKVVEP